MRKITILGLVLGLVLTTFGQMELIHKEVGYLKDADIPTLSLRKWNHTGLLINGNSKYEPITGTIYFGLFDSSAVFEIDTVGLGSVGTYFYRNVFGKNQISLVANYWNSSICKITNLEGQVLFSDESNLCYVDVIENNYVFIHEKGDTTYIYKTGGKHHQDGSSTTNTEVSVEDTLNIDLVTSVGEVAQNELRVWNDNNTIHYQVDEAGDFQVLIFNTNAQVQHQNDNFTGTNGSFDASGLAAGLYFITINDNDGVLRSETKKIVIR